MATIHKLDNHTINSIAAGEVVERPASVAKELIDNALDAGASIIRISMQAGGIRLLEVEDDGFGMSAADAALSLESHATSKLAALDDLLRIETMGFRGEALASIAAVSRLELRTRLIASDTGSRLLVEGGKLISSEPAGMKEGTTVTVRDLFFNTPARYKFLKTDRAEGSAVVDMVGRLALARPDVSFRVRRIEDKKDLLHTPGNNDLLSAIYAVFGRELAEAMTAVEHSVSPIKVKGYMTLPAEARHNRSRQLFVVNQRVIQSPTLRAAADEAGKTWFMKGRFPALVLHLDIPPELVDVNVHPQKSEIRVWDEKILFRSVYQALQECLSREETIKEDKSYPTSAEETDLKTEEKISPAAYGRNISFPQGGTAGAQLAFADTVESKKQKDYPAKRLREADRKSDQPAGPVLAPAEIGSSSRAQEVKKTRAAELAGARYIGSLLQTYLLFEAKESLFIIDQHAAHERIIYENLLYNFNQEREEGRLSQTLLLPVRVNLSAGEMTFFTENEGEFARLGFVCEPFGETSLVIRAVPSTGSSKNELDPAAAFRAVLEHAGSQSDPELAFSDTEIFHDMACKAAVKANDSLSQKEAEVLLSSLLELDNPYHCPHGRPVIVSKSRAEFEKNVWQESLMAVGTQEIRADTQAMMLELVRRDLALQAADVIPILTGPTASGKSSLAMAWCEQEDRELISADSMQIYRGFDIGTAKATRDEQARVLHHLIDIKDAQERYSVAQFVSDACEILVSGQAEGRRFLICGGTGQYISALYEGLKFSDPAPSEELRHSINEKIAERGLQESYALLAALDPEAAEQISPENRRRIVRFFEKFELTGKTLSELNAESRMKTKAFNFRVYQLNWDKRQNLYNRINQRTEAIYDAGLISETRSLIERHPSYATDPAFYGIGYREALQHIKGELTEAEARENTATATRRYAKRQLTWFRPKDYVIRLLYSSQD